MKNMTVKAIVFTLIIMLLASCASLGTKPAARNTAAVEPKIDASENLPDLMKGISKVGILEDICIAEHMNALLLKESVSANHDSLTGARDLLKKTGFFPVLCPYPYVGSYITDQTGVDVKVGSAVESRKPPFILPPSSDKDKEYNEALMKVIASVADMPNSIKNRNASFKPDDAMKNCLSIISGRTGANGLIVIVGQAQIYLKDKNSKTIDRQSGNNIFNPSPDSIQIIDLRKDDIEGFAVLIDFKSSSVIWSNAARMNLPEEGKDYRSFFKNDFPAAMLKGFPSKQ